MARPSAQVLSQLGVLPGSIVALKDVPLENASWLAETQAGERVVIRRYHAGATPQDLIYEHEVLRHVARKGWSVPEPVSELLEWSGRYYCLTRHVPGAASLAESISERRRRGRDLARLHLALRELGPLLGQRPGWRAQHTGPTVHTRLDWAAGRAALAQASPRLATWLERAAAAVRTDLAAAGAHELPLMIVHGDFTAWNVHYHRGRLAGVLDFGLTHLDSRPYELATARTYRAPEAADAYRAELIRRGWPLTDLEEACAGPVYRAFRVDMAAWQADHGLRTGRYNLPMIERQLARTRTVPPG